MTALIVRRRIPYKITLAILLILAQIIFLTGRARPDQPKREQKPGLILVLVVDQMRADYLTLFRELYSDSGFRLLMDHGAWMKNCFYPHVPTTTAPGHSVILSGVPPGKNGIISNSWYSMELERTVQAVKDPATKSVGTGPEENSGRKSPGNFHATTLADFLSDYSPGSRIIGISIKDRGAILPLGRKATAAFWFDESEGLWITSTYYCSQLPTWVQNLNAQRLPEKYLGKSWERLLSSGAYNQFGPDSAKGEGTLPGEKEPVFPHVIKDLANTKWKRYEALLASPFGNDLTTAIAESCITGEMLGQRGVTDILCVSFSTPDYCGHIFGPHSHEIADTYLRLDLQLRDFFRFLRGKIAPEAVNLVLTADHGVAPLPEEHIRENASRINVTDFIRDVKSEIGSKFNYDETKENLVRIFSNDYFYLDTSKLKSRGLDLREFETALGDAALKNPHTASYYTRTRIETALGNKSTPDNYLRLIFNGYNAQLSGHVLIVPKPYCFFSDDISGTSHGTGYEYDTHVPLLFYGKEFMPGIYPDTCSPYDISATLAHLLGFDSSYSGAGSVLRNTIKEDASWEQSRRPR